MTTIAMTREMGSLGRDVALGLAERLGLDLIHHELVENEVAARLDRSGSQVHRFLEGGTSWLDKFSIDKNQLGRFTGEAIIERALKGNVILRGWGAAQLLADCPHVLRVRVCAPIDKRIAVVMARTGMKETEAIRREIEANDAAHTAVIERLAVGDWRDPESYDIVLNTERLPVAECVEQVLALIGKDRYRESEATNKGLADGLLKLKVEDRLRHELPDDGESAGVRLQVDGGRVVMEGNVARDDLRKEIERLVRETAGVVDVSNRIVTLRGSYGIH